MALSPGTRLGSYEIKAPLGAGGMGEVYRARDTKLHRDVALKVLPQELSADREALARFEREARAAASLSHPNVLGIHEFNTDGGIAYAVLELLEGETLRQWLTGGPLPSRKTVDYLTQVACGLAAAHTRGIVHRDLKPENIFVTREGCVKILDFGLAKLRAPSGPNSGMATEAKTDPGTILGTVGYMSPEQVRGLEADARSDIFSFGAILYEALSGLRAFRGDSPIETMNAILRDEPPELPETLRGPVTPLERIARRCMEKRPEDRFQNARDLGFALEAYSGPLSTPPAIKQASSPARTDRRSIAVLPFKDLSRDPESAHLGVGLADATITELALVRSLLVRPTSAILSYRDRAVSSQQAGQELGTDAVLDASFQRFGSRLRVTVQLVRTEDGQSLWGSKIDTSLDDLFEMQDQVSRKITEALQVELTPNDERRLGRTAQPAAGAYELYLKGRVNLLSEKISDVRSAIQAFEKAHEIDPKSPLPLAGLADAYSRMAFTFEPDGGWYERAVETTERALAMDPNLPEGRYLRARQFWSPQKGFQHAAALREFAAAAAARPSLNEAHHWMGSVLLHLSLFDEAMAEYERALAINPEDSIAHVHKGLCRLFQGRWEEARAISEEWVSRSNETWMHYQLAHSLIRLGDRLGAARTLEGAPSEADRDVLLEPIRAILAALQGDRGEAHRRIEMTIQNRRAFGHYHHAQYDLACTYALLNETDAALRWLTDAAHNGFPCYGFFAVDPLLASVKNDPRFRALMKELEAECDGYRELWHKLRVQQSDPSVAR